MTAYRFLAAALPHRVTIRHPGVRTDGYGDEVDDWDTSTTEEAAGYLQHTATDEILGRGRDAVSGQGRVFLELSANISAADRVEFDGRVWEVDGDPQLSQRRGHAIGWVAHLKAPEVVVV